MMRLHCAWLALAMLCSVLEVARAEPPPLEAYGGLPELAHVVLSPSGRRLAFIVEVNGKRRLQVLELPRSVLYASELGEHKIRSVQWAGDDYVALTVTWTHNLGYEYGFEHELTNVLHVHLPDARVAWLLPATKRNVLTAAFGIYGFRQQEGRWYGYVGTLPVATSKSGSAWISGFEPSLSRIDLATGKLAHAFSPTKHGRGWLLDMQGNVIAVQRYNAAKSLWSLHSTALKDREIVSVPDPFGDSSVIGQGRAPGSILYTVVDAYGAAHYMEASLTGETAPQETLADWDVDEFVFDPATGLLAGAVKAGNEPELVLFDEKRQARVRAIRKALPDLRLTFQSWSDDFNRFIVFSEGQNDSGTWWFVDIPTGNAQELGWRYPQIKSRSVAPFRMVQYSAADGMELEGVLTTPPNVDPVNLPVVVLPHGGPEWRDYAQFDWWAQAYASRGYAVWQPNFRGSSGYGVAHRNAGLGEWDRKMQTDVSDGLAELAKQGIVDAKRACIVGASYGGYAALAGVTVQQGIYRCAVAVAGVSDLGGMLARERQRKEGDATRYWRAFMGAKNLHSDVLDRYSPAKLARQTDAPVLLIHGRDDTVVPIDQSRTMHRALRSAEKPGELIELEGEDHWLSRDKTRIQMLEASMTFLLKHNPPGAGQ